MQSRSPKSKLVSGVVRGLIEAGSIIFLFYSNLLMGEYNGTGNARSRGLIWALNDIFTKENFLIAIIAALAGYVVFEYLRKKI